VLITNPRDMPGFVKDIGRAEGSVMTGVNTLFSGLLNTPGFDRLDFSAVKVVGRRRCGGARPVAERWKQVTGIPITRPTA